MLPTALAHTIRDAFVINRTLHSTLVQRAQGCFESRDWHLLREVSRAQAEHYRESVDAGLDAVRDLLGHLFQDKAVWREARALHATLIAGRQDWNLAETYFNSITRRVFSTVGVDPTVEYVHSHFPTPPAPTRVPCARAFPRPIDAADLVEQVLATLPFHTAWEDRGRDAALAGEAIARHLQRLGAEPTPTSAGVLAPVFYRGKGAYVIARLETSAGPVPMVLCLRNAPRTGLFIDAVLLDEASVSRLFSFAHSAFLVDVERPHDTVSWLRGLLPRKRHGELYISLGLPNHGKTELFRELKLQLQRPDARFVIPEGIPGLVMVVFTLTGFDWVFKVIRDRFPHEKQQLTPAKVRERYAFVAKRDKGGRIVDAQSFEFLTMPRKRFDDALLEELQRTCGETVRVEGDEVVFDWLYVERKVTPLDLVIRAAPEAESCSAVDAFGRALRDLAASDIFPGDLLPKNFGVTRHGRVVFYDYDEVCALSQVRFRDIPEPRSWEEEMSGEAWFHAEPEDVFPEEFPRFFGLSFQQRQRLMTHHAELFTAAWWRGIQQQHAQGKIFELTPYRDRWRLRRREH